MRSLQLIFRGRVEGVVVSSKSKSVVLCDVVAVNDGCVCVLWVSLEYIESNKSSVGER